MSASITMKVPPLTIHMTLHNPPCLFILPFYLGTSHKKAFLYDIASIALHLSITVNHENEKILFFCNFNSTHTLQTRAQQCDHNSQMSGIFMLS